MSLEGLAGRRYGPFPADLCRSSVARFVSAVGDDRVRWERHVPPTYAAALLFEAAPAFLDDPDVAPHTRSLIHTDQTFRWRGPLESGGPGTVSAVVAGIRARGPLHLVTFEVAASGPGGLWMEGAATFLMAAEAAAAAADEPEPGYDDRGPVDPPAAAELPEAGEPLAPLRVSASRADLVRYAAASGDFNPIHWDHGAARAAGLPGIVVHGMLMAAWVGRAASRHVPGPDPLRSMRLRFRRTLRPAVAAEIVGAVEGRAEDGADLSLTVRAGDVALLDASARVTR